MFASNNDVDVVPASQAVIHDRQEAVRIGRQVDAHDFGFFVYHMVNETGVLVRKAIVILPPDLGGQQVIERSNFSPPREVRGNFQISA